MANFTKVLFWLGVYIAGAPVVASAQTSGLVKVFEGRTTDIAIANDSVAFAVTWGGTLLSSHNGGRTWSETKVDSALTVQTCPSERAYVGTLSGLLYSDDYGESWHHASTTQGRWPTRYVCLPNNDVLVDGGYRLWVLRTDSMSYKTVHEQAEAWGFGLSSDSTGVVDAVFYGCLEDSCGGLLTSSDGGDSFVADTTWPANLWGRSVARTSRGTLLVGSDAILRRHSTDTQWEFVSDRDAALLDEIVPAGGDTVLATGYFGLVVSVDDARTWSQVTTDGEPVLASGIAARDNSVLVAGFDGIWRSQGGIPTGVDVERTSRNQLTASIHVYPNPVGESLTIRPSGFACSPDVETYDVVGRKVDELEFEPREVVTRPWRHRICP